jgi:sugar phosphate isomerase/epimerase
MLELACALHLSHAHLGIPKAASLVAEAGFDALEISPWIPRRLSRADINSLRTSLQKNGLTFSGFTSLYPPEMILASPSSASRRKNILYTRRLIELTRSLGGKLLVWGSGRSRNIPRDVPFRKGEAWLVELLRASGDVADQVDVKIAIEPLNRFESTIIHNISEALSLAQLVNRRSVGVAYDTFHTNVEENSFTKPILLASERLAAVHISDCNRKIPGRGHIDFRPIFYALKKIGYDGYVTLEAILSRNPRQDLVAARKYMQNMID